MIPRTHLRTRAAEPGRRLPPACRSVPGTGREAGGGTPAAEPRAHAPVVRIAPSSPWRPIALRELWEYRELLYFLAWRDFNVRYKQTVLGIAWALIQPLLAMVVFTVFFGKLAKMPSGGIPYPIFSYAALVPWTFFANALTQASNSTLRDGSLISKVYFPRLVVPLASVLAGAVDFALAFAVLLAMMAFYGFAPTAHIVWVPLFALLALGAALGVGLWTSASSVQYRDVRYVVPFLVQMWFFATPVVYPTSLLPGRWRVVFGLNPMAGVVEGFRWALLGGTQPRPGPMVLVSALVVVALLVSGAFFFRRMERTFADVM
jgi:lipopolysaccharide transport system permease protein